MKFIKRPYPHLPNNQNNKQQTFLPRIVSVPIRARINSLKRIVVNHEDNALLINVHVRYGLSAWVVEVRIVFQTRKLFLIFGCITSNVTDVLGLL